MNIAIIKAGGVGSRMGAGIPKQFISVRNKPIIVYTLEVFEHHPNIDKIVVVSLKGWEDNIRTYAQQYHISKIVKVVEGGDTSLRSVKNAIFAIQNDYAADDRILIHDANRPLVSQDIISDVLAESEKYGMAVAAIPCTDEVAITNDSSMMTANAFADHKKLCRIQTPDAYTLETLLQIYGNATEDQLTKIGATNVLAIQMGYTMHFATGSEINIRLTTMDDIILFKAILMEA